MARLSIGKLRGLGQLADSSGVFLICAMDHRGSLRRMIQPEAPEAVSHETMVSYKLELCSILAPEASAVLLDPEYGAPYAIASGALPPHVGLLVSMEETGYIGTKTARLTRLLTDWGVEKVKRMGASAAKLLLYYHPEAGEVAAKQRELVGALARQCRDADIPCLVEPVSYPLEGQSAEEFARKKPDVVVRTAQELTALGIDVLKAEFPADLRHESDEGLLFSYCRRLDEASQTPWVLLSAGVTFEEFARELDVACKAGASGFLAGRAVWQEAMAISDGKERRRWLATVAVERLRRLKDIALSHARPWWRKWADSPAALVEVGREWYKEY